MEEPSPFEGVVAVFEKDIIIDFNDRYGQLTGNEILRNIGHLLQASIRLEDEAFRNRPPTSSFFCFTTSGWPWPTNA